MDKRLVPGYLPNPDDVETYDPEMAMLMAMKVEEEEFDARTRLEDPWR